MSKFIPVKSSSVNCVFSLANCSRDEVPVPQQMKGELTLCNLSMYMALSHLVMWTMLLTQKYIEHLKTQICNGRLPATLPLERSEILRTPFMIDVAGLWGELEPNSVSDWKRGDGFKGSISLVVITGAVFGSSTTSIITSPQKIVGCISCRKFPHLNSPPSKHTCTHICICLPVSMRAEIMEQKFSPSSPWPNTCICIELCVYNNIHNQSQPCCSQRFKLSVCVCLSCARLSFGEGFQESNPSR